MAISLLQDAVEATAHEAAASVNAPLKPLTAFLEHWDAISKLGSGKKLPYKIDMTELNAARVNFKHLGVNPAVGEAEKQRVAAHRFLVETAREFFGADFDDLSEADLIADSGIQDAIKAAESALSASDPTKSLEYCREALDTAEKLMAEAVAVSEKDHFGPKIPKEFRTAAESAVQWANRRFAALQIGVTLSILRVNPAEYWFLYDSLPLRTAAGGFSWPPANSLISKKTPERARACIRIIVDLTQRVERVYADLQRLVKQSGVGEERRLLKELQDKTLDQQIPNDSGPEPP
jgi:hypothetical protein